MCFVRCRIEVWMVWMMGRWITNPREFELARAGGEHETNQCSDKHLRLQTS